MKKNATLILFGLGIIIILFVVMELRPQIYMPLERFLYDQREFFEIDLTQERNEIVILDIDEKSVKELGRYHDWPRYYFGKAINVVSEQRPYVIGLDVIFSVPDSLSDFAENIYLNRMEEKLEPAFPSIDSSEMKEKLKTSLTSFSFDSYVAESIKKAGNVVLASYLNRDSTNATPAYLEEYYLDRIKPPSNSELTFEGIVAPIPLYLNAGATVGMVNDVFDPDGVRRKDPLFFNYRGHTLPSFSLEIATSAVKDWSLEDGKIQILGREIPLEGNAYLRIKYQGDAKTFRYISFVDVVKENIPDTLFTRKIVLFGSSLPELYDYSQTPFGAKLPGVECHANVIHNLLFSKPITTPPKYAVIIISIFLIFITLLLANKTAPYISPIIAFIIVIGYLLFTVVMYMSYFVSYEMSRPVMGIVFAFLAGLISRIYFGEEEKKWIKDLFSRYVSEEVVKQITNSPSLNLEGKRQDISVLFCDIRSFTPRAEKESPENIVNILNAYFEEMSSIIFQHGGMVDKYLGDGIMALFGAPIIQPGHADRAVSCAIKMQNRIHYLNQQEIMKGEAPLVIGIGISSGVSVIGNVGSTNRIEYTAIGDPVNTAARIEPLNKEYQTRILISENTKNKLQGTYKIHFVGKIQLKGKSEYTGIYAITSDLSLW